MDKLSKEELVFLDQLLLDELRRAARANDIAKCVMIKRIRYEIDSALVEIGIDRPVPA